MLYGVHEVYSTFMHENHTCLIHQINRYTHYYLIGLDNELVFNICSLFTDHTLVSITPYRGRRVSFIP